MLYIEREWDKDRERENGTAGLSVTKELGGWGVTGCASNVKSSGEWSAGSLNSLSTVRP